MEHVVGSRVAAPRLPGFWSVNGTVVTVRTAAIVVTENERGASGTTAGMGREGREWGGNGDSGIEGFRGARHKRERIASATCLSTTTDFALALRHPLLGLIRIGAHRPLDLVA